MALGARRSNVVWMILRQTLLLVAIGAVIGLAAAVVVTRLIESRLYGLTPTDPATLALGVLLMAGVGVVAGYLPARRASNVDPMTALGDE